MSILIWGSFLLIVAAVWIYAYQKSRSVNIESAEGYFMGGRSLTALPIAGTIIMTNLSTEQIVGQNAQSYVAGMEVMAWEVTATVAIVALALVFLPRYFELGINTISDLLEIRYDTTVKRIVSALFIFTYMSSFLPVVLYSGALVFDQIFDVSGTFGLDPFVSVVVVVVGIGIVGILYLLMGGLSLSANSDTIYGVGLLVVGLLIPFLGVRMIGDGSFLAGLQSIQATTPELLNSVGALDSDIVPWPTLVLGLFFNNLYFWCCNQMIIQKAFSAKNLGEAQKASFLVGIFKTVAALFLVFPGIVGRNLFGDSFLNNPDIVYPTLVNTVLPVVLKGVFAAVIFGAVLSSFAGALNSTATLFALDFYKPMINPEADDKKVARIGKLSTVVVGVISVVIAPFIAFAPAGLYQFVQEFNGLYNISLLVIILFAFYSKTATTKAAKATMVVHIVLYAASKFVLADVHYLYVWSALFFIDALVMWAVSKFSSEGEFVLEAFETNVDSTPYKHANVVGAVLIILVILTYLAFSPLGLGA